MCARPAINLQVDPFFEGEGSRINRQLLPGYRNGDQDTFAVTDPRGNQTGALAGRSISSVLPGRLGATIVPEANPGGVPDGFSPNDMSQVRIYIDPHINGAGVPVDLGRITPGMMADAAEAAAAVTPPPRGLKMQRFRGSATMHALSQATQGDGHVEAMGRFNVHPEDLRDPPPPEERPALQRAAVQYTQPAPAPQAVAGGARRLLSSFTKPAVQVQQPQGAQARQADLTAAEPKIRINFEIKLMNPQTNAMFAMPQTALYHFVHRSVDDGQFLLGWNENHPHKMHELPEGENAPEIAMEVEGRPEVYLVQVLPVRYAGVQFPGMPGKYTLVQLVVLARLDEPTTAQG